MRIGETVSFRRNVLVPKRKWVIISKLQRQHVKQEHEPHRCEVDQANIVLKFVNHIQIAPCHYKELPTPNIIFLGSTRVRGSNPSWGGPTLVSRSTLLQYPIRTKRGQGRAGHVQKWEKNRSHAIPGLAEAELIAPSRPGSAWTKVRSSSSGGSPPDRVPCPF